MGKLKKNSRKRPGKKAGSRKVGRPLKSEVGENEVREKILDAAEKVFSEKGVHGAGLREIAKVSQHSLAIVTYYFKTKDNLVREVIERSLEGRHDILSNVFAKYQGKMTMEGLMEIIKTNMRWYSSEAGRRAYRIQSIAKFEAFEALQTGSAKYWTTSTDHIASIVSQLNPKLDNAEARERAIIMLMLFRARTDLYWFFAHSSGQIRKPSTVVQNYENWLFNVFVPALVDKAKP